MSVQVSQYKVDDLAAAKDPDTDILADTTLKLALDGEVWEIDLTEANEQKLRKKLEPYMAAGRRIRGRAHSRPRPQASRNRSRDIRRWAAEHHIQVSARGRIPAHVIEQYDQTAHA